MRAFTEDQSTLQIVETEPRNDQQVKKIATLLVQLRYLAADTGHSFIAHLADIALMDLQTSQGDEAEPKHQRG